MVKPSMVKKHKIILPQETQKSGDLLGEEGGRGHSVFLHLKLSQSGKLDSQMNFVNLLGNCGKMKKIHQYLP